MTGNKKRAQNLYAALFSEKNWARWEVLIRCDDPKVNETARELLMEIQSVLQAQLASIEDDVADIKDIEDALGVDITASSVSSTLIFVLVPGTIRV